VPDTHLFRVLWLFWTQQDLEREAWPWVEQLLPAAGTLDPQARAELAWAAAVLAVDVGDDAAALAARQRLAPLLGRYDDALRHLLEARDLAEGTGGDWLGAGPRVQLGILAVLRGRLDEARPLLDEALDLSMTARSTPFVTLCLAGYAQLAFADGHPDRAALPEGAAEGLRRRVGQPAWPHLRRAEGELAAQVRHRLGDSRFDQAISAGSRLTQREAVAIVRDR
jgi:tetratricopeptide (TPR) repeat protein